MNCSGCWPERLRRALVALLPLAALLLLAAPGPAARAAPAALRPCRLPGVPHEAQCGMLTRALDPADERGTRIELHFAVLPALARQPAPDPVFFIAGGPGQSAIDLAGPVSRMLARLGRTRDIVLVDQRGTGRSAPLHCDDAPGTPTLRLQALPYGELRHFGSSVAMADLDAVRQALGATQINLVAASYGTRAALEYLRLFPLQVRRVVLDGVVPPDMALADAAATDALAPKTSAAAGCTRSCASAGWRCWRACRASCASPIR